MAREVVRFPIQAGCLNFVAKVSPLEQPRGTFGLQREFALPQPLPSGKGFRRKRGVLYPRKINPPFPSIFATFSSVIPNVVARTSFGVPASHELMSIAW